MEILVQDRQDYPLPVSRLVATGLCWKHCFDFHVVGHYTAYLCWLAVSQTTYWRSLVALDGDSSVMGMRSTVPALDAVQIGRSRRILDQLLYLQQRHACEEKSLPCQHAGEYFSEHVSDTDRLLRG